MRSFTAFRLSAQLCFCAAVLCLFHPFRDFWPVFALLVLLAFLAGLGAAGCSNYGLRLLWGLLPALAMALAYVLYAPWLIYAAAGAVALYTVIFCGLGRFALAPWQYRPEAITLLVLCPVCFLLSGLGTVQSLPPKPLSAVSALLVLLALRAQKMGRSPSAAWQAGNAGLFVLPILGGAAGGALLWLSIPALRYLAAGLGILLGGIVSLWNSFWGWLMGSVHIGDDFYASTEVSYTFYFSTAAGNSETASSDGRARLIEGELPWQAILIFLGGVLLIFLVIWLIRRGGSLKDAGDTGERVTEVAEPAEARPRRSRRSRRSPRTERDQVRALYREYLMFLGDNGVRPRRSDTTSDISDASAKVLAETDEQLRALYRKARYSQSVITPEEVREGEALLAALVASKQEIN